MTTLVIANTAVHVVSTYTSGRHKISVSMLCLLQTFQLVAILPESVTLRLSREQKKLHLKGAFVTPKLAHCQAQELKELNW